MITFNKLFSPRDNRSTWFPGRTILGVSQPAYMRVQASGGDGMSPRPLLEPWSINPKIPILLSPDSISHRGGSPIANPIMSAKVPVKPY